MSGSDEPFDPEAARLAARIRRLMLISGATTVIAIGAVFAVIGYRVFKAGESAPAVTDATVSLPKGARVISTSLAEGRIAVTIDIGGAVEVRIYDARTLRQVGRLRLNPEP